MRSAACQLELVVAQRQHLGRARQGGIARGVIHFIGHACILHIQRGLGDGGAVLSTFQRVIVCQATLAVRQHQATVVDALVCTGVLVVEAAIPGQEQTFTVDQPVHAQLAGSHVGAGVIVAHAVERDDGPVDCQRPCHQIDVIPLLTGIHITVDGVIAAGVAHGAIRAIAAVEDLSGFGGTGQRIAGIDQAARVVPAVVGLAGGIGVDGQCRQEAAQQRRGLACIDAPDGVAAAAGRHVPAFKA